jgi:hypothetical protein
LAIWCFGYRSSTLLRIRDETSKVTEKARRSYTCQGGKANAASLTLWLPEGTEVALLHKDIALPLEATAIGYFFSIFSRSGIYAYLPAYATSLAKDESFVQAMCASSLGSMALQERNEALSHAARCYYTTSLARINRDLADPETRTLDNTLLRVLILSAFEALNFHEVAHTSNWAAHIEGSCRLLVLRGKEQLQNQFGRELFHHASVNILVHSIYQRVPVPVGLLRLLEHATSRTGGMDYAGNHILFLLWRMSVIATDIPCMEASEVLENLIPLDVAAGAFLEELQKSAPFEVIDITNVSNGYQQRRIVQTFEGIMHRYRDHQIARLYNIARLIRLTLKEWIYVAVTDRFGIDNDAVVLVSAYCNFIEERDRISYQILSESTALVVQVLASVPYSFDELESRNSTEARYLIWPLARIASFDVCLPSAKRYIATQLTAIAQKLHLTRAMHVADGLGQDDLDQGW